MYHYNLKKAALCLAVMMMSCSDKNETVTTNTSNSNPSNLDSILNESYYVLGNTIMNKIFVYPSDARELVLELNQHYKLQLGKVNSLQQVQLALQKKANSIPLTGTDSLENDFAFRSRLASRNMANVPIRYPLIVGTDYKIMYHVTKEVVAREGRVVPYLFLTSDRPLHSTDIASDSVDLMVRVLSQKQKQYMEHRSEIAAIMATQDSLKETWPELADLRFAAGLIGLLDRATGNEGLTLYAAMKETAQKDGAPSAAQLQTCRDYATTKAAKLLPTEHDMAEFIARDLSLLNAKLLETKNNGQAEAPVSDRYNTFLQYVELHKLDMADYTLINANYQVYHEWLELIYACNRGKQEITAFGCPNFVSVDTPYDRNNHAFVEEMAQLFGTLSMFTQKSQLSANAQRK